MRRSSPIRATPSVGASGDGSVARAGFDGTGALYPDHVAIANAVYAPSPRSLPGPTTLIARFETLRDGRDADTSGGKLVMVQHYEFAKSLRRWRSGSETA